MINIDDSNVVKCPHCSEELDAYRFDGFVDAATIAKIFILWIITKTTNNDLFIN